MIVRAATEDDLYRICDIAEQFVEEAKWPVTFSYGNSLRTFSNYLREPNAEILVVDMNGALCGGALLFADRDFHFEPFGYIGKFYIVPEARKTMAAYRLIRSCVEWFDSKGVVMTFVTATAGLTERSNNAFIRIMERVGFRRDAPILIKGE